MKVIKIKKIKNPINAWKAISRKKRRLLLIGTAFLLLLLAACYTVFIAPLLEKEQWVYKESAVERGTLTVGVSESGSLDYGVTSVLYDLNLDVSTDDDDDDEDEDDDEETIQKYLKIEEIYVAPGQRIAEGDALLKLTEDSVSDVRRLLQSALVDAKSDYNEAESEYNLSALEAQTTYDTQVLEGQYASGIYGNASKSVNNDISVLQVQIDQCNANISILEEKVTDAQEDYDDALEDYNEAADAMSLASMDNTVNYMTVQSGYLSAQTKYQNAKTALEQAQQSLTDNAEKITSLQKQLTAAQAKRTLDKLDVEQTYQESVINGENAQITYNAQIESLKETLAEAEEEKNAVEDQLEAFETFVGSDGVLYAEGSGIVTQVAYEAGDSLEQTGVIVAYAAPADMTISVDVTQEDVVDLAVGDKVEILFGAYEDEPYEGTILSIDTTATSESSNTVSYTVVISVEDDTEALYGGMTADITFVTEEKEEVLYISKKAIVEQNDKKYVYKKTALGGRELTEVETGISNGVNIEILSGLSEGDTIYIASRVSSEAEVANTDVSDSDSANTTDTTDEVTDMQMPGGMENFGGMQMPGGGAGMQMP